MNADLESEIVCAIKTVPALSAGQSDGMWTVNIKRALLELGRKHNFSVCASGFSDDCDGEWLYDLLWYRNDLSNHLREIGLIVESEWSRYTKDIKYDFEKLLVAKYPLKVMVFQNWENTVPEIFALLENGIRNFHPPCSGEKYILCGYDNPTRSFTIKTITT